MKTVIVGAGKGCIGILDLATGPFLRELILDVKCVVDIDPGAPGVLRAKELGIPTSNDLIQAMWGKDLELVIELTGSDKVLEDIYRLLPHGVRLIDHTIAHIFWDLANAQKEQEWHLVEITKLEEKIETERRFLQSLFDTLPDLIIVFDRDKKVIRTNAAFLEFGGFTAENVEGSTCFDVLRNTELFPSCDEISGILDDVLRSGRQRSIVWQTARPREAYWEIIHTPILGRSGSPEGVVGTWHRITERIMLHREIESAEQRFKSFIDSAHDWISIKDLTGRYLIVNPVCAQAFGLTPGDFIGHKPEEILPVNVARIIREHDTEVIKSSRHRTYHEVYHLRGRDRHFQTVRFPLTDHGGETTGICTIARDVTSEKELNDQLVQAAKLAAVGKLAAGVAHEINNPLTGILAFAEDLMSELPDNHRYRHDLGVIVRETIRCREIVRNLLDFARFEKLDLQQRDPNRVVEEALLLVHKLPQFRNISITKNLVEKLPSILCDMQQLQQVILNLMLNSADAMDGHGQITLRTSYDVVADKCIIAVEDNGPGIPDELADRVFEPFFSTKGTNGLGLAVSWGIAERHHGTIVIEESEQGGAVFKIVLPASGSND
ncbi:MAG: PAS domain-containing protein [Candidatus Zixiibacteriota bacterium]|nr:MAG: PAS domain-containing protein [candidate division Zixibacteria bacterium]